LIKHSNKTVLTITVFIDIAKRINDRQIYFEVARGEHDTEHDESWIFLSTACSIIAYLVKMGLVPTLKGLVCRF